MCSTKTGAIGTVFVRAAGCGTGKISIVHRKIIAIHPKYEASKIAILWIFFKKKKYPKWLILHFSKTGIIDTKLVRAGYSVSKISIIHQIFFKMKNIWNAISADTMPRQTGRN